MKNTKIVVTLLALLAMVTGAQAQTFFNENFDGSDYTAGQAPPTGFGVINYGDWTNYGSTVTNAESFSSPNSLLITSGDAAQGNLGTTNTAITPATGAVDFHFALETTSAAPGGVARLFDSASNELTELSIGYQAYGELSLDTNTGFINITTLAPNTWYNVDVLAPANPGAGSQYTINVYDSTDTTLLGTATGDFYSTSTTGNYEFFQLQNVNSQSIYFDNVSVTELAAPEPSTLALIGLGGLGLAFLAVRRRHSLV